MEYTSYVGVVSYTTIFMFYIFSLKCSSNIGKHTSSEKDTLPQEIKVLGQFQLHFFTVWTFVSIRNIYLHSTLGHIHLHHIKKSCHLI